MRLIAATILMLALAGCADMTPWASLAERQPRETAGVEASYDEGLAAPSFAIVADKADLRDDYSRASLARQQLREAAAVEARYEEDLAASSFAVLAGKVNLREAYRRDEEPCASIKEDRLPTGEERAALRDWAGVRESYFVRLSGILLTEPSGSAHVKDLTGQFQMVMDNALRSQSVLIDKLAEGELTYCQFAEYDKAWTDATVQQTSAIRENLRQVVGWEHTMRGTAPNP